MNKTEYNQLIQLVKKEAKLLKIHATEEELSKLDFTKLQVSNVELCIYGQMTGHCESKRANELINLCNLMLYDSHNSYYKLQSKNTVNKKQISLHFLLNPNRTIYYISPIEKFIYYNEEILLIDNNYNQKLIKYLKGETKTLNIPKQK